MIVGITGTPGTGKKSIAPLVAAKLGVPCLGLNDLARSYDLVGPSGAEVDTERLRERLEHGLPESAVVYGHLLPYSLGKDRVSKVVVLRCEPAVLKQRLGARGYPHAKVVENVEAELIGVIASDAHDAFGESRTWELDTTHATPLQAARAIFEVAGSKRIPQSRIDWTLAYDSGAKLRLLLSGPD